MTKQQLQLSIGAIILVLIGLGISRIKPPIFSGVTTSPTPVSGPTYFAEVDQTGTVLRVIVASQEFIDSGAVGDSKNWVETKTDGTLRKNYAGKGYKYDKNLDAFISPKPIGNWGLDSNTDQWINLDIKISPIASL